MVLNSYGLNSEHWYIPEEPQTTLTSSLFFQLSPDAEVQEFLDYSSKTSDSFFWQTYRNLATMVLSSLLTKTSVNGITGFGTMFLFSTDQFRQFVGFEPTHTKRGKQVLDLGAGNGAVTEKMETFFEKVFATEMSSSMRWRLKKRGYTVLDAMKWHDSEEKFDLITAFNLMDRHYNANLLLKQLHGLAIRSKCNVVVSLVLPIKYYVEFNPAQRSTKPETWLDVNGRTYIDHVGSLIKDVFGPANFEVLRWTRMPYLCEGDFIHKAYHLPDAMFLLKPLPTPETVASSETTSPVHIEL